jgi:hypothetical protein
VQVRDRDLLVLPVRVRSRAWAEVDRVDSLLGELRDGSPGLLRRDLRHELPQPLHKRIPEGRGRGRGVVEHLELARADKLS